MANRPWPWPCFSLQEIGNDEYCELITTINPPIGSVLHHDLEILKVQSGVYNPETEEVERQSPRFGSNLDSNTTNVTTTNATNDLVYNVTPTNATTTPNTTPSNVITPVIPCQASTCQEINCQEITCEESNCESKVKIGIGWNSKYFSGGFGPFGLVKRDASFDKNVKLPDLQLRIIFDPFQIGYQELDDSDIEGRFIDGYELGPVIGRAAHSIVFLGKCESKTLSIKVSLQNRDAIALSLAEIHALRLLNQDSNNNFLHMIDSFFYRGRIFMVSELLGPNLYDLYSGSAKLNHSCKLVSDLDTFGLLSIKGISIVAKSLLIALAKLNSLGIFHGDVKPENVLTSCKDSTCNVKLIDFGSCRFISECTNNYQQSRPYRAPEMVLGLPYDTKADLWSLGAMLAELWIGRLLFPSDNNATLMASIISLFGEIPKFMLSSSSPLKTSFFITGIYVVELGNSFYRVSTPQKACLKSLLNLTRHVDGEIVDTFHDLLTKLLTLNPAERSNPEDLLNHPFVNHNN